MRFFTDDPTKGFITIFHHHLGEYGSHIFSNDPTKQI